MAYKLAGPDNHLIWLSFADESGFLGVAIVEISPEDIAGAALLISREFPRAADGAEVVVAAVRKTHKLGINPGGQVLVDEIDPDTIPGDCINRLIAEEEIDKRGLGDRAAWKGDKVH